MLLAYFHEENVYVRIIKHIFKYWLHTADLSIQLNVFCNEQIVYVSKSNHFLKMKNKQMKKIS